MDANKLKVLQDINYTVRKVCDNCKFAKGLQHNSTGFGTCAKHHYKHLKHTGEPRELSINKFGYCNSHEWWEEGVQFTMGEYFWGMREK